MPGPRTAKPRKITLDARRARERKWRSRIPKDELVKHLAEGRSYSAIGRMYDTDHTAVLKLIPSLDRDDLLKVVKARPVTQVPVIQVRKLSAVDVADEMLQVLELLHAFKAFMTGPGAEVTFPDMGRRIKYTFQVLDRIQRWVPEFLAVQQKLTEWTGYDVWRDEILGVLEEIEPGLREKVLQRVTAKVFVERGPVAAGAVTRALTAPTFTPEQVPPSLRSLLDSPEPKPLASATTDASSATSAPSP